MKNISTRRTEIIKLLKQHEIMELKEIQIELIYSWKVVYSELVKLRKAGLIKIKKSGFNPIRYVYYLSN